MFGRTKEPVAPEPVAREEKVGGKNRPTPKRDVAQAANRRPLVAKDRRGATASSRGAQREERARAQAGRLAGEQRYLPVRDQGPVRQYVRDVVDTRRNAGDWFMPFIFVDVVVSFIVQSAAPGTLAVTVTTLLLWVAVLVVIVDSVFLRARVRRRVAERFGPSERAGMTTYAVLRAGQMRRLRIPRAVLKPGDDPR